MGSLIHDEYMEMAKTKPWTKSVVQLIISFGSQEEDNLKRKPGTLAENSYHMLVVQLIIDG